MPRFKTIKIIFYLTALLLAAKPFIGFGLYGHFKSDARPSIFMKIFAKRNNINNHADCEVAIRKLGNPLTEFFLRFSFLLALLFPFAFITRGLLVARYLQQQQLGLSPRRLTLLTGQLLI